jgi:hypothetical protein
MATEAARLECKESTGRKVENRKRKTLLTHTGLLMEGNVLLECFLELLTPANAAYGQLVCVHHPRYALENNRIALKREMR